MKKLSILTAVAAAMIGLTACEADKEPVFTAPQDGEYVLEAPAFAETGLAMVEENADEVLNFVSHEPNFGADLACTYSMQVSLDPTFPENFTENYVGSDPYSSTVSITEEQLSLLLCNLHGFDPNNYEQLPPESVWVRTVCHVTNYGDFNSTPVELKNVTFFHVIAGKRVIYLVGQPTGWTEPGPGSEAVYANWELEETEVGTNVYFRQFEIEAGTNIYFRFYSALTGWGDDGELPSLGPNANDGDNEEILANGATEYIGGVVPGKGSWFISSWLGGLLNMTVDLQNGTVKFEMATEIDYSTFPHIYVVGDAVPGGWNATGTADQFENSMLYDLGGNGVYVTPPGKPLKVVAGQFRFYTELGGWGSDAELPSIGSGPNDFTGEDMVLADGVFNYTAVPGKGSWIVSAGQEGDYEVSLDLSNLDGGAYPLVMTLVAGE